MRDVRAGGHRESKRAGPLLPTLPYRKRSSHMAAVEPAESQGLSWVGARLVGRGAVSLFRHVEHGPFPKASNIRRFWHLDTAPGLGRQVVRPIAR